MAKRAWIKIGPAKATYKLNRYDQDRIGAAFSQVIADFKKEFIPADPNTEFNHMIDIYSEWRGNSFYLCQKDRYGTACDVTGEFDSKFVRLQFIKRDSCHLSFMRYTGQWVLFAESQSIAECIETIVAMPYFHPVG